MYFFLFFQNEKQVLQGLKGALSYNECTGGRRFWHKTYICLHILLFNFNFLESSDIRGINMLLMFSDFQQYLKFDQVCIDNHVFKLHYKVQGVH